MNDYPAGYVVPGGVGQAPPVRTEDLLYTAPPWYLQPSTWAIVGFGLVVGLALDATRKKGLFDPRGPRLF